MPQNNESDIYSNLSNAWGGQKKEDGEQSSGRPMTPQEMLLFQAMQGSALTGYQKGFEAGQKEAQKPKNASEALMKPIRQALLHLADQTGRGFAESINQWADGNLADNPTFQALTPQPHHPSKLETKTKQYAADQIKRVGAAAANYIVEAIAQRRGRK